MAVEAAEYDPRCKEKARYIGIERLRIEQMIFDEPTGDDVDWRRNSEDG
jgi:hypothetical protein